MKKNSKIDLSYIEPIQVPAYGMELMNQYVLPDLLGKETKSILYWAGKNLARKLPLSEREELISYFRKVGWGELIVHKEKNNHFVYHLTSDLIKIKLKEYKDCHFQLEAGFLAQQIEQFSGRITETYEEKYENKGFVQFTIKSEASL